jgi:hypothetical protein
VSFFSVRCLSLSCGNAEHAEIVALMPWKTWTNHSPFPPIGDAAYTSHRIDELRLSGWDRFKRSIWLFGHRLKEPDMLFSFKTGNVA